MVPTSETAFGMKAEATSQHCCPTREMLSTLCTDQCGLGLQASAPRLDPRGAGEVTSGYLGISSEITSRVQRLHRKVPGAVILPDPFPSTSPGRCRRRGLQGIPAPPPSLGKAKKTNKKKMGKNQLTPGLRRLINLLTPKALQAAEVISENAQTSSKRGFKKTLKLLGEFNLPITKNYY